MPQPVAGGPFFSGIIISRSAGCPASWLAALFAAILMALATGCEKDRTGAATAGIPVSPEFRPLVEAALADLDSPSRDGSQLARNLDLYARLQQALCDPDLRAAAADSLFAIWSPAPTNFLWPELAMRNLPYLGRLDRLEEMFDRPILADSTTAVGAYMRGWRNVIRTSGADDFRRAWESRSQLRPAQLLWLTLKMAWVERTTGHGARAFSLVTSILPRAGTLGGRPAEVAVWTEITRDLKAMDRLDDALHAMDVTDRLAEAVAWESGNLYTVQNLHVLRADILAARRESEAALALYEACADTCLDNHLLTLAGKSLNRGGILTAGTGEYETGLRLYRKELEIDVAADDSVHIPRTLMNIARRHRLMGRLDSCLVYQLRAETWVEAYPIVSNRSRLPLMQAEYFAQIGDYATVDSLLSAAASMTPNLTSPEALAELHLQIIKDGMERGSPAAAYRSIALLDSLRGRLNDSLADRYVVADLDLYTAEFLIRQGQYVRARSALDQAEAALERRPDPNRAWRLSRTHGMLAHRRGDLAGAEAAYRVCVDLAERIGDPDLHATGSLLLCVVLMEQERSAAARGVLDDDGGRFRTRLTMKLFRGMTYTLEGLHDEALAELESARALCTPWSPRDLVARIDLEAGRALAGQGRARAAESSYARVREELSRHGTTQLSGDEADYYGDLRRELVEAELTLATRDGRSPISGPKARRTLERTCALLPDWRGDGTATDLAEAPWPAPQLIFFCGKRASFRWDVTPTSLTLQRLAGERDLATQLGTVLADLGHPGRDVIAAEMATLVAELGGPPPIRHDGQTLLVVPDGVLNGVPWAALAGRTPEEVWLDLGPIIIADAPRRRSVPPLARPRPGRLLALGIDGVAGPHDDGPPPLRHAENEAREIHDRWPPDRVELRVGDGSASIDLRSGPLSDFDVIHLASHAMVYRGSAREATLVLAGDRPSPLTAREIRGLDLDAELVFLSCCEAADGSAFNAGRAHADLARSFLEAGAATIVAPTLMIEDEAARRMAGRFYDGWLAGAPAATALHEAQVAMRDDESRFSHPFYWAFYIVLISDDRYSLTTPASHSEK